MTGALRLLGPLVLLLPTIVGCGARQGIPSGRAAAPDAAAPAPQEQAPEQQAAKDVEEAKWTPIQTDFPFQSSALATRSPVSKTVNKSIAIRLGDDLAVSFDTDLLRMAAGWTGPLITPTGVAFDTSHGTHPQTGGVPHFTTAPVPGWSDSARRFEDPRRIPYGPLPESWGRWDGIYTSGMNVVLSYTVGGTKIHEQPAAVRAGDRVGFVRTIQVADLTRPLALLIADVPGGRAGAASGGQLVLSIPGERQVEVKRERRRADRADAGAPPVDARPATELVRETTEIAVLGAPAGSRLEASSGGRVLLQLPRAAGTALFRVVITRAPTGSASALPQLTEATGPLKLIEHRAGGPRHWPRAIVTRGVRAPDDAPYVIDRITTPYPGVYQGPPRGGDWKDNIFRRRIMIGGFDFFPDGKRAALCTWEGDVWIVDGIDGDLDQLRWQRFASGLYEPLGLKIAGGVVHVAARDQITRLHDLNGDGEADFYQNFNNQVTNSQGFHEFQFDLQQDARGNFYTAKASPVRAGGRGFGGGGGNGEITPFAGTIQRISADGKRREVYATGLRAPNGIGVSPDGQVTAGDNEGTWMPACPIHWVRPGSFHGVENTAHRKPLPPFDPPLCWISKSYDNSGGGQVWVTSDRWGPLAGELLHLSYGRATIYLVMKQRVGARMQGGIVPLIGGPEAAQLTGKATRLTSSAMRARFNPVDGQLYVTGLAGWQTDAVALTGFDRVRYTGKPVHTVRGLRATRAGVELSFQQPLDPSSVDAQSFSAERWNYLRSSAYGSPEFSVESPGTRGHDRMEIRAARLSDDRRSVLLDVEDLRPADQMLIRLRVKAADGTPIRQSVMHTIHQLPPDPRAVARPPVADRGQPGLLLRLEGQATHSELVPAVKLHVRAGETASPFLAPGPFTASWQGTLWPELRGEHLLMAEVSGDLRITLNDEVVLTGSGSGQFRSRPLALARKPNRLGIVLRSAAGKDTTLRLFWARREPGSDGTATAGNVQPLFEPIPATAFRHPRASGRPLAEVTRSQEVLAGRALFLEHRCGSCHLPEDRRKATAELAARAPDFGAIGSRLDWRWLRDWVLDPRAQRSDATMPALLHGSEAPAEAHAIAAYLASLRDPALEARRDQVARLLPQEAAGAELMAKLRCGGCHIDQENSAEDGRAPMAHARRKFLPGSLTAYLEQPAAHFPWNPMPHLRLSRTEALQLEGMLRGWGGPPTSAKPPAQPAVIARGRELVQVRGCLRCHDAPGAGLADRAPAAGKLGGTGKRSCLQGTGPARYALSKQESAQLQAFVTAFGASDLAPAYRHVPSEFAQRQVRQLRCLGCHENDRFQDVPGLDRVGEKLRPEWVAAFISGQIPYKPRAERHPDGQPWLPARMPAFAGPAALLAAGLAAGAGHPPITPAEQPLDPALARAGATLVSASGGLSCVACHGVGAKPATQVFEVEGINLSYAAERLRPDFFRRWLHDPMRIDPSTKMPRYFDESGQSPLTGILGGRAHAQIAAIWDYLRSLGGDRDRPVSANQSRARSTSRP